MDDIVERLRNKIDMNDIWVSFVAPQLLAEAADEIERLRKEIERLRKQNSSQSWQLYPESMGR